MMFNSSRSLRITFSQKGHAGLEHHLHPFIIITSISKLHFAMYLCYRCLRLKLKMKNKDSCDSN